MLAAVPELRHLSVLRCCSLAAADDDATTLASALAHLPQLPSLRSIALGWGTDAAALRRLCSASPCLTALTLGMGASVTDAALQAAAEACPHLQTLDLRLCTVSDAGVGELVRSCQKLRTLKLLGCVGPFGSPLVQGVGTGWWGLQELQLVGGAARLTLADLQQLLGGMQQHRLHTLALSGVRGVSEELLDVIAQQQCSSLQHLRLEDCSPAVAIGTDAAPAFSTSAMLTAVKACTQLRTLALRHCCMVPVDFVETARAQCCLLSSLVLDSCDMEGGGLDLQPDLHHPLYKVQLCKCKAVQCSLPGVAGKLPKSMHVLDLITGASEVLYPSL